MLIFHLLHCIVHVTSSGKYLLTPTQMCRGYVDLDFGLKKLKFEIWVSTQVPLEKVWFCMLIFELLHCIVHVTFEKIGLRPCLEG